MRLVRNPSYTHSDKLLTLFYRYKANIYFKDYSQYQNDLLIVTLSSVEESKKLGLKSSHILWLTKQIYENRLEKDDMLENYLQPVNIHFKNRKLLKPIEEYRNISELNQHINQVFQLDEFVSEKDLDIFFEKDGWFIAMPHTTQASCLLGKDTDWCTARTKSQNLFLSYVAKYGEDIVLFYVIKINGNPQKNPYDKLSVGFIDGKPIFDKKDGGLTVNAKNEGFTIEEFGNILGTELAQEFLIKMDEKSQEIKGKHPAKKEMDKIAKSTEKYLKKISEFKNDEYLLDFKRQITEYPLNEDIQMILSDDDNVSIRSHLARNKNLTEEIQIKLTDDDEKVRLSLALNQNITETVQLELVTDIRKMVKIKLAENTSIAESIQLALAKCSDRDIRRALARNEKIGESIQLKLADDNDFETREVLAGNLNIKEKVQFKLADDRSIHVRELLYANPNIKKEVRALLSENIQIE